MCPLWKCVKLFKIGPPDQRERDGALVSDFISICLIRVAVRGLTPLRELSGFLWFWEKPEAEKPRPLIATCWWPTGHRWSPAQLSTVRRAKGTAGGHRVSHTVYVLYDLPCLQSLLLRYLGLIWVVLAHLFPLVHSTHHLTLLQLNFPSIVGHLMYFSTWGCLLVLLQENKHTQTFPCPYIPAKNFIGSSRTEVSTSLPYSKSCLDQIGQCEVTFWLQWILGSAGFCLLASAVQEGTRRSTTPHTLGNWATAIKTKKTHWSCDFTLVIYSIEIQVLI